MNVVSIGAGGGSIAWLDAQGILRVGPQSAEAVPGPACYERGGVDADRDRRARRARLSEPGRAARRRLPISTAAARGRRCGRGSPSRSGSRVERAALGIFDVINANMVGGIRAVSVERGHDPRDFALVAGGGATAAHAGAARRRTSASRRS